MRFTRSRPDPYRCSEPSSDGDHCDLQPEHGGLMHSGVRAGRRVWWDKTTGKRVDFRRAAAS